MGTLWRIVWDGLKAFIFWLVAAALLIYFLGYPGYMLSILLGLIFLACFCALRFAEILAFILTLGRRPPKPPPYVPPSSPPTPPPAHAVLSEVRIRVGAGSADVRQLRVAAPPRPALAKAFRWAFVCVCPERNSCAVGRLR